MIFWRRAVEPARDPRHDLGERGENEAVRYLRKEGYAIVERNVRTRLGELDLVARQGDILVFVEVKTRSSGSFAAPELSVDGRKQRKLLELASAYMAGQGRGMDCRFDVLGIILGPSGRATIHHIPNAFQNERE